MISRDKILVRAGHEVDLPKILALVKELAVYERAADEVNTTIDEYKSAMRANLFRLLVAEVQGEVVGMMLYYEVFSTWKGRMVYLEDFVVAERVRRSGAGALLWQALIDNAKQLGARGLRWQVLDWNEPAKAFYRKVGAELEGGWENGRLFFAVDR